MLSATTLPGSPALQERSRRSAERIVAAALELLATRNFEDLSVNEIAARARLSVGGFYARFADKSALLHYLNASVIDGLVQRARELLSEEATRGFDARGVIERYVSMAVRAFRKHKRVLQQVSLRSRTSVDPRFRAHVVQTNRLLHDLLRERLWERRGEIGHRQPRLAIDVALTAVSGAMREYVLFQEFRPHFAPVADVRLISELTDMFCAHLRIERSEE